MTQTLDMPAAEALPDAADDTDAGPLLTGASATYSPEDNKLRLYPLARLSTDLYDRVKKAGFKWAPKQELFVAPMWTPEREDLLVELAGEVGDEDTSLVDRAEAKADRLEELSDKREADARRAKDRADALTERFAGGQPILVGHHSERKARRDAAKAERAMGQAVSCWRLSQYWADRAKGAIANAKYKELPAVRARRIKKIEADKRKVDGKLDQYRRFVAFWGREGITREQALAVLNRHDQCRFTLPDGTEVWSAWSALDDNKVTVEYVREKRLESLPRLIAHYQRWSDHYANRLAYERAMQAESGGTAADRTKPQKGGACKCWVDRGRWLEIQKVNKVSVSVLDNWGNGGKDFLRTVPFDKLTAVITPEEWAAIKAGTAPAVRPEEAAADLAAAQARQAEREAEKAKAAEFEALADRAKAGIVVERVEAVGFYPTPPELAARMADLADVRPGHSVLEPSAGTGRLLDPLFDAEGTAARFGDGRLTVVELHTKLAAALRRTYACADVHCQDFLQFTGGPFDRVLMNPPFDKAADVRHITHAMTMLKPGGRLVALCANGPRQRESLMPLAAEWHDLPAGSFESEGTGVNVALLVIDARE